jgi:hypothetical protein
MQSYLTEISEMTNILGVHLYLKRIGDSVHLSI